MELTGTLVKSARFTLMWPWFDAAFDARAPKSTIIAFHVAKVWHLRLRYLLIVAIKSQDAAKVFSPLWKQKTSGIETVVIIEQQVNCCCFRASGRGTYRALRKVLFGHTSFNNTYAKQARSQIYLSCSPDGVKDTWQKLAQLFYFSQKTLFLNTHMLNLEYENGSLIDV